MLRLKAFKPFHSLIVLFLLFLILVSLADSYERTERKMGLRDIQSTLPPGFRFCPSDEELVCYYLYKKVANERVLGGTLVEVDLHTREPWELPGGCMLLYLFAPLFSQCSSLFHRSHRANKMKLSVSYEQSLIQIRTYTLVSYI